MDQLELQWDKLLKIKTTGRDDSNADQYTTPERLIGYEAISEEYKEDPLQSGDRIFARIKEEYSWATEEQIRKVMK